MLCSASQRNIKMIRLVGAATLLALAKLYLRFRVLKTVVVGLVFTRRVLFASTRSLESIFQACIL
jgi:hypothetical protein